MDDKSKTDFRDRASVNSNEEYEVRYWTEKWKISEEELREAIRVTGTSNVKTLEEYLRSKN